MDMRFSLQKLEVFRAVVLRGGVNAAAEHLYVSQPVVSAHIRDLETKLGVRLFRKEGRRLVLTEEGEAVYEWANDSSVRVRELERRLSSMREPSTGTVAISAGMTMGSYALPRFVTDYCRRFPNLKVSVDVALPERVIEAVVDGSSEIGVLMTDQVIADPRIGFTEIGRGELILVAAPDSGLPEVATAEELSMLPFISTPADYLRRSIEEKHLRRLGVHRQGVAIELGHPEAIKHAVSEGLGVALLYRFSVERELRAGTLKRIGIDGVEITEPILVITRAPRALTGLQGDFHDELCATFMERSVLS